MEIYESGHSKRNIDYEIKKTKKQKKKSLVLS